MYRYVCPFNIICPAGSKIWYMVELREGVKRLQGYTEGLEEAYDDLRKEVEETKAGNKDMEKEIEMA